MYLKSVSLLTFWRICVFSYCVYLKYCCVPKIGIPADMFIDIFCNAHLKYCYVPKSVFSADILTDSFIDMCIGISIDISSTCSQTLFLTFLLTCWPTFVLSRRRGEEGRKEGVDFFLKSNNPNLIRGEMESPRIGRTGIAGQKCGTFWQNIEN